MYNLLRAGFYRLKKDIIFWLFLFVTIGASIFALFRIAESGDGIISILRITRIIYIII